MDREEVARTLCLCGAAWGFMLTGTLVATEHSAHAFLGAVASAILLACADEWGRR